MKCRHCNCDLSFSMVDLVFSPLSNSYLLKKDLQIAEVYYPLKIFVCENCWLVQVDEYEACSKIFNENYMYFSSFSSTWQEHARIYVEQIIKKLKLTKSSSIMEIASNDGYLLQYFNKEGIPCFGIEPATETANSAINKGIETINEFFSNSYAINLVKIKGKQDLIIGNNVLAHVPNINDFVEGMAKMLKEEGTITMEFPHLLNLLKYVQFDTIYHEHFSYLSLGTVSTIFSKFGLEIYDVETLPTHGGSLRIYASHIGKKSISRNYGLLLDQEKEFGLFSLNGYKSFQDKVNQIKYEFLSFLIKQNNSGKRVCAYGAAAKGNTLLNYSGIKGTDLIKFVGDTSPYKCGLYLPGSHIPVVCETEIKNYKPDFVVIFPWNIKNELSRQLYYIREWGGKFAVFIPKMEIW